MNSPLIPGLEEHLVKAANGLALHRMHGARRRRRFGLAGFIGAFVVTSGALAAVTLWSPQLGDGRQAISTSPSTVPADQLQALSVLRRAQSSQDRDEASARALELLRSQFHGVRVSAVRRLDEASDAARGAYVLVSASVVDSQDPSAPATRAIDPICVLANNVVGDDGPVAHAGTANCWTLDEIKNGNAIAETQGVPEPGSQGSAWSRTVHTSTCDCVVGGTEREGTIAWSRWYGLVPDGVSSVRIAVAGKTQTVAVHDNFFTAQFRHVRPSSSPRVYWLHTDGRQQAVN